MSSIYNSIVHNMTAMGGARYFGINTRNTKKSTEKLSSGYRVNRAADDAAGLAISERMRRQVRGLSRASENCQDGIGLCQVKDGALSEVNKLLHRMTELSVKAANGTLSADDRQAIQQEINALSAEINRIGSDTEYNEIKVFDYDGTKITIPGSSAITDQTAAINTGYLTDAYFDGTRYHPSANLDFSGVDEDNVSGLYDKTFSFTCSQGCPETFTFKFIDGDGTQSSVSGQNNGRNPHIYTIDIHGETTGKGVLDQLFNYVSTNMPNGYTASADGKTLPVSHSNTMYRTSNTGISIASNTTSNTAEAAKQYFVYNMNTGSPYAKADCSEIAAVINGEKTINALCIQAGADAGQFIYLTMDKMNAKRIGVDPVDVTTQTAATNAIQQIKEASAEINRQRAVAGAEQNRLEHAIANLDNVTENTAASESRIRDTDMATEMVELSKLNILGQAGTSMITQANQSRSHLLGLLA